MEGVKQVSIGEPVLVPDCLIDACIKFGDECYKTTDYGFRGQRDLAKIKLDHAYGKIGEWVVYSILKQHFPSICKPDMKIYGVNKKTWGSDLVDNISGNHFAVKTQTTDSATRFGMSWIFQKGDKEIYCKPSLEKPYQSLYVCLVLLNVECQFANVQAVVKCDWLHTNNCFKPLKIARLNTNKQAVYYNDIREENLWQI